VIAAPAIEDRCGAYLDRMLPDGPAASVEAICGQIARLRGRPIQVIVSDPGPLDLPTGLWLHSARYELIWVDARTSPLHRIAIAGHELGHMLCEHEPSAVDPLLHGRRLREFAVRHCPDLPAETISAIMGRCFAGPRSHQDRTRELEAEFIGRALVARVLRNREDSLTDTLRRG
jgi:hypothetical protein